ncbi:MAG: hypothetical protein BV456_04840 [Thermoplasmata archaeon M8B2D]|nr:MAG: hypothetical protein BV456_04840 [Thermoplasmata archaeon M8B2D]
MYRLYKTVNNKPNYIVICNTSNKALFMSEEDLKDLSIISETGWSAEFVNYSILNHICDIESYEDLITNYPEYII